MISHGIRVEVLSSSPNSMFHSTLLNILCVQFTYEVKVWPIIQIIICTSYHKLKLKILGQVVILRFIYSLIPYNEIFLHDALHSWSFNNHISYSAMISSSMYSSLVNNLQRPSFSNGQNLKDVLLQVYVWFKVVLKNIPFIETALL